MIQSLKVKVELVGEIQILPLLCFTSLLLLRRLIGESVAGTIKVL